MTPRAWVTAARRSDDLRGLLERIAREGIAPDGSVHAAARRLEALAEQHPAPGALARPADGLTIDTLCRLFQAARARRDVPCALQRLWSPTLGVGEAICVTADGEGAGRMVLLRVGPDLGRPRGVEIGDDFAAAVEAARAWVRDQVPSGADGVQRLTWTVDSPLPVQGGSVFLAACVAFTSAALRAPLPVVGGVLPVFTGCAPSPGAQHAPREVSEGTRAGKLAAVARHGAGCRLYGPGVDGWPTATVPADRLMDVPDLRRLLDALFPALWRAAGAEAAPPAEAADPQAAVLIEAARAALSIAHGPLADGPLFALMQQAPEPVSLGGLRLRDLLKADRAVVADDSGRWILARAQIDGRPSADPVRAGLLAKEGAQVPAAEDPLRPARRAFEQLRHAPDVDAVIAHLQGQESLVSRRLALALLCAQASAPLQALAAAVVADDDGPSLTLALQAVAEVALYLQAAPAVRRVEAATAEVPANAGNAVRMLRERPSLGRLASVVKLLPAQAPVVDALDEVPKLLNRLLHHFGGWQALAQLPETAWARGEDGWALLAHVTALVAASPRAGVPADGTWIRPGAHGVAAFDFFRGVYGGEIRWWAFTRGAGPSGGATPGRGLPNLAIALLPTPLAWLAVGVKKAATRGDGLALVAALDRLVGAWLRLAAAVDGAAAWRAKGLHFTRVTKARLLTLADGSPLQPAVPAMTAIIRGLERLEHHPGPVTDDFARRAHGLAAAVFEALAPLTAQAGQLWMGTAGGARGLRGMDLGPVDATGPALPAGTLAWVADGTQHPLWPVIARAAGGAIEVFVEARQTAPKRVPARLKDATYLRLTPNGSGEPVAVPAVALDPQAAPA